MYISILLQVHNLPHVSSLYLIPKYDTLYNTFLTFNILYVLISYYVNCDFQRPSFPLEWFEHMIIVIGFLFSSPWGWTQVAETYCWLLYNKITFIHPSAFFGVIKKMFCMYKQFDYSC
jgi:hypothetical protein